MVRAQEHLRFKFFVVVLYIEVIVLSSVNGSEKLTARMASLFAGSLLQTSMIERNYWDGEGKTGKSEAC